MSITFACGHCGKSFTLDEKFAGKKGKCKQCGSLIQIPGGVAEAVDEPRRPAPQAPSPRRAPVAVSAYDDIAPPPPRRSASRSVEVASDSGDDPYGLEESPLPARSLNRNGAESAVLPRAVSPVAAKKKKKAGGFFGAKPKKSKSSGGDGLSFVLVVRIGIALVGVFLSSLVLPGVRSALHLNDVDNRSELEVILQKQIELFKALDRELALVTDVASAAEHSPRIIERFHDVTKHIRANSYRKGQVTDIEALKQKYETTLNGVQQSLMANMARLAQTPGVVDALNIQQAAEDMMAAAAEAKNISDQLRNGKL